MARVLFLDIDGVLNSNFWNDSHQREISDGTLIDEEKIKLLAYLVNKTNAKIILHSGWRFWFDKELKPLRMEAGKLVEMLKKENLFLDGSTPDLTTEEIRRTKKYSLIKADEILMWLNLHPNVTEWVVLDDLDLHNVQIEQHQVKPDQTMGLTMEDVEKAEKILLAQAKEGIMEISYRTANMDDLDDIFQLVENAVKQMEEQKIFQWDSIYPTKEDFRNDIKKNQLYIGIVNEKIVVVYALNKECEEQYKNGEWQYTGDNFNVIHRLCVSPDCQNKGIAHTTLLHIENELRLLGIKAVRLDVFCENPYALKLYSGNGYQKVGIAHWRKGKFFLMEKLL